MAGPPGPHRTMGLRNKHEKPPLSSDKPMALEVSLGPWCPMTPCVHRVTSGGRGRQPERRPQWSLNTGPHEPRDTTHSWG
jgi:hypothetical protein